MRFITLAKKRSVCSDGMHNSDLGFFRQTIGLFLLLLFLICTSFHSVCKLLIYNTNIYRNVQKISSFQRNDKIKRKIVKRPQKTQAILYCCSLLLTPSTSIFVSPIFFFTDFACIWAIWVWLWVAPNRRRAKWKTKEEKKNRRFAIIKIHSDSY